MIVMGWWKREKKCKTILSLLFHNVGSNNNNNVN